MTCPRPLRNMVSCVKGVTAVEFGFIAPVFFLMVMGIVELSLIMFAQHVMEGSLFLASRTGKTGYSAASISREQTILNTLQQKAGALLQPSRMTIQTLSYSQFDKIGQGEPFVDANNDGIRNAGENYTDVNANGQFDADLGAAGPGTAGQITVYTLSYPWPVFTPLVGRFIGHGGVVTLSARAVVQNEPF